MTNHGTHETPLEWHGFTAIWFNPDGKLRDFTPGVSRFLKDTEEIVPESKGKWFIIEENSTDAEVIASAISTSKVPGVRNADGSPVYSEGVSGEAYLAGDPDNFESDNFLGRFSLNRDVDQAEQQTFDLLLHRSTFPMLSKLVRSAAKHLHPDYISGINIAFNQDMINARTASWDAVPLVGLVSWVRGLHPHELAGYPVTNIEEYEGGLYFEAISDQAGTTLAQLADHLEHIGTRHTLGLLPEHSNSVWPNRPGAPTPLYGNPTFQAYVAGLELPEDGSPLPVYVITDPHGKELPFHGHVWRSVPDPATNQPHPQEIFLTALGGFPTNLPDTVIEDWAEHATHQIASIPPTAHNEWHLDNRDLANRLRQHSTTTTSPPASTPTAKPPHEIRTFDTAPQPGSNSPDHDGTRRLRDRRLLRMELIAEVVGSVCQPIHVWPGLPCCAVA